MGHLEELHRIAFRRPKASGQPWAEDMDRLALEADRTFKGLVELLGRNLATLEDGIEANKASVEAVNVTIAGLQTDIASLQGDVATLQADLSSLQSTVAWEKIASTTHSGAAVQSLSLLGTYDADLDEEYWFRIRLKIATGSSHHIRLEPRATATSANYSAVNGTDWAPVAPTASTLQLVQAISIPNRFNMDLYLSKRSSAGLSGHGEGEITSSNVGRCDAAIFDAGTPNISAFAVGSNVAGRILADSEVTTFKRAN